MNVLENSKVKEYISSLNGKSSCHHLLTECGCINGIMPLNAHDEDAKPFSKNLAELALNRSSKNPRLAGMYVSKKSYFMGDTMKLLVHRMFDSKDAIKVDQYYNVLYQNFSLHPPCAPYMATEYENFILTPCNSCLGEMSLWDYLMDCFNQIISGSILYGNNIPFDLAFKKSFSFCVSILQMNFELSKKNGLRPLIMKCLKFNPERRTRMSEITKILDMLFNTGYDFQMPVINLAILVHQMMARDK